MSATRAVTLRLGKSNQERGKMPWRLFSQQQSCNNRCDWARDGVCKSSPRSSFFYVQHHHPNHCAGDDPFSRNFVAAWHHPTLTPYCEKGTDCSDCATTTSDPLLLERWWWWQSLTTPSSIALLCWLAVFVFTLVDLVQCAYRRQTTRKKLHALECHSPPPRATMPCVV